MKTVHWKADLHWCKVVVHMINEENIESGYPYL